LPMSNILVFESLLNSRSEELNHDFKILRRT
jgi:hypothetical protein